MSADVVDVVSVTGGFVLASCCCTAAMSLGSMPASLIPGPGPSNRAKTGAVAGRVAGLALDAI